jgi:sterol desaturase/sphingolipid hydroxylase (fatty acid hydroxylase superfamily)
METAQAKLGDRLLELFLLPTSRTYWLFLITGLLIAGLFSWYNKRNILRSDQRLLSHETWLSRSAINDYGIILMNVLIFSVMLNPAMTFIVDAIQWISMKTLGMLPKLGGNPSLWAPVILTVSLFIVDDFIRYISHYCEHRIPILWELHKVHHSAEVLNFMTAERHHPLSMIFFRVMITAGIIFTNGIFLLLFGDHITVISLFGGNIIWMLTNLIGGTLRHSPVWISFGPHIEKWLISPAQHQIHHSIDPRHFDRNFGGSLAIWDRLFGTLYVTTVKREDIRFGLGAETAEYKSLFALYIRPLRGIIARFTPNAPHPA